MKRVTFTKEAELYTLLFRNLSGALESYFGTSEIGGYRICPAYSIGTISDFFRVIDALSEDVDIHTGKKPTTKQRREAVRHIEERGGHSGATWGYILSMVRIHYPQGWRMIQRDWSTE